MMEKEEMAKSLVESYEKLDETCVNVLGFEGGVNDYISEMLSITNPEFKVDNWEEDYDSLCYYKNLIEKITTNDDEDNELVYDEYDVEWVNDYWQRIDEKEDPLNLFIIKEEKYIKRQQEIEKLKKHDKIAIFNKALLISIAVAVVIFFLSVFLYLIRN